ncbi:hypothetical protein Cgig2_033530 [Carnegiea gigantea]|uniref:Uncharacterized protein n=1 Tax=Carnegiea gigantea TaxID=171969 RepID=A0A9Q1K1P1_9CARY|nr:hypothetical protein Cgig2_033530 [Carnegiea gigantea]
MWSTVNDRHASRATSGERVFHPSLFSNNRYLVFMAFPCSLDNKAMAEYITCHFAWDRHGALCLSFELTVAKEAAEYYELPELSQVIFYTMLLNEAERLGVVQRRALRSLELALVKLRWSTFELWDWLYGNRIFEARFRPMAGSGESSGVGRQEEGSEVEPVDKGSAIERALRNFSHLQLSRSLFYKYNFILLHKMFGYSSFQREWYTV